MKSESIVLMDISASSSAFAGGEITTALSPFTWYGATNSWENRMLCTPSIPETVTLVPPSIGPQLGNKRALVNESGSLLRCMPLNVKSCSLLLISIEKFPPNFGLTEQIALDDVTHAALDVFAESPTLQTNLFSTNLLPVTVTYVCVSNARTLGTTLCKTGMSWYSNTESDFVGLAPCSWLISTAIRLISLRAGALHWT